MASNPAPKEINLIWQSHNSWEPDWIRELLSDLHVHEYADGNFKIWKDNSIIVIGYPCKSALNYFKKLKEKRYKFGVILLGDETYSAPKNFHKFCKFVFRNYWHKNIVDNRKVFAFPLGYKQGFWKNFNDQEMKDSINRNYIWSFAGQIAKSTRRSMIENMKKIENGFAYEISTFDAPESLSPQNYRDLLFDSIFVPCPRGWWNLDSFRVYEALECGCIPIVERTPLDYFTNFYGRHPFISVYSWEQAPQVIHDLLSDPTKLEQRRLACHQWWMDYKKSAKNLFKTVVENAFR